jgi:Tfp pilus assembly protein FimT
MQVTHSASPRVRGFTFHEVVGVLAVIAILTCLMVPAIVRLLDNARLAADVKSIEALRTATHAYFERYGKFAGPNGAPITSWSYEAHESWDRTCLLASSLVETALRSHLATNAFVRLVKVTTTSSSTLILSSRGRIGSLPGFNSNNGYYNLTQDYARLGGAETGDRWLAQSGPCESGGRLAFGYLSTLGVARFASSVAPLVAAWSTPEAPPGPPPLEFGWPALGGVLRGFSGGAGRFECCYPVPPSWPVPPAGFGTTTGGTRRNDPGARTQIVAVNPSEPAIVVEVVLQGVAVEDAYRLSLAIDGPMQTNWAFYDSLGRVKYDMYDGSGGTRHGIVFVYLAHK